MLDSPDLYQCFLEANRYEEKLQHHIADTRFLTPGLEACLRGLWRGRSRYEREQSAGPNKNKNEMTVE